MKFFGRFYLDNEKDMIVNLYRDDADRLFYELETPNHHTGNLIRNFAAVCRLPLSMNKKNLQVIRGEVPAYVDGDNRDLWILRFGNTKVANIFPDGRIEQKASVPAIAKTLMSQTKDYRYGEEKTIFKTYILRELKFRSDLHTHMNGNLSPDILIALGIAHQIRYPLYYVRKLGLVLSKRQEKEISAQRAMVARQFADSGLEGKYLARKINDNTFINFADLILRNIANAGENIVKIRISLSVLKDGQAVFTNLEKVYLYRYVFCKGTESEKKIELTGVEKIPDDDVKSALTRMLADRRNPDYWQNSIFQDKLLWIARQYRRQGITYAEISDTTLVKKYESLHMLTEVHEVMPAIFRETGVMIRFLAAMRRIPLTIVKDQKTPDNYLEQNLSVLRAVALDPYVAGSDFVGEEINSIEDLQPVIREVVRIAANHPDFVIRIHAGENDSLRENVANSIACVKKALAPGQKMPRMRIGHGLYTSSLKTAKGKKLLRDLRDSGVVLEFQLTSNVRLNNLNALENHPLHEYLRAGIPCVQGTDGAALYGTNSIDEQLSLEKLLALSSEELRSMKRAEERVIADSMESFRMKSCDFRKLLAGRTITDFLLNEMEKSGPERIRLGRSAKDDANTELQALIRELPWDAMPVIVAGGSFNTAKRTTRVTDEGIRQIELLMKTLTPSEAFFVVGYRMSGYEKYLLEHNTKGFRVFCFVPSRLTAAELRRIRAEKISVRVSTESEGMGIYKSFNYEIFERRPSIVVCFDGNSAAENLIQEAKNGKGRAAILIWDKAGSLREKAKSLEGYVRIFGRSAPLADQIRSVKSALFAPEGVDTTDWYQTHKKGLVRTV
ncbi:MAG: adenosine deaminase [Lachnospiraceae bacterium]|jgi:adenosine deaminase|nr:adenosine deaminase [Lachnospiraceae bacterium]MCI1328302.1 adenosine deaminase [Lachnospiraceae bacterium]